MDWSGLPVGVVPALFGIDQPSCTWWATSKLPFSSPADPPPGPAPLVLERGNVEKRKLVFGGGVFHEEAGAGGGIPGAETEVVVQGGMGRWTGGGKGLLIVCASLACNKSNGAESVDVLFVMCVWRMGIWECEEKW